MKNLNLLFEIKEWPRPEVARVGRARQDSAVRIWRAQILDRVRVLLDSAQL